MLNILLRTPRNDRALIATGGASCRRPAARMRGFTLVEIMIVVLVIGILAMMARAATQRILLRSRASAYMNDCRVFSEALARYAQEKGSFPADQSTPRAIPPGMDGYLNATKYSRTTPLGGYYDYDDIYGSTYSTGWPFRASIKVDVCTLTMAQHLQIDRWFDDGNLSTGNYRVADGGFTAVYVVEK